MKGCEHEQKTFHVPLELSKKGRENFEKMFDDKQIRVVPAVPQRARDDMKELRSFIDSGSDKLPPWLSLKGCPQCGANTTLRPCIFRNRRGGYVQGYVCQGVSSCKTTMEKVLKVVEDAAFRETFETLDFSEQGD